MKFILNIIWKRALLNPGETKRREGAKWELKISRILDVASISLYLKSYAKMCETTLENGSIA